MRARNLRAVVDDRRDQFPRRGERGAAAVWMLITTGALVAILALVGGGGEYVNEQVEARRAAEQAARAGADALSYDAVRSGNETSYVDVAAATTRAKNVLAEAGWSGTVKIDGNEVTVTATGTRQPLFLNLIGINSVSISETGTAVAIRNSEETP